MLPPLQIFGDLHPRPPGPTPVQATISILNVTDTTGKYDKHHRSSVRSVRKSTTAVYEERVVS